MKKIISVLMVLAFVVSTVSVPISFAASPDEFVNENVIVNGDFEGSDTLIEDLAFSGMPDWKYTSSGWISYSQWHSQISIKPEEGNEDNHVLSFDGFTDRSNGVMQVLPTARRCTGVYHIKFRARKADNRSNKADIAAYVQFVYNKNGGYVGNTNIPYRAVSRGAEEASQSIFTLADTDWHEFDIKVDVMANDGAYKNFTEDIAGIRFVIRQAYGTANKVGVDPDYNITEVQFDDIEIVMPEPLMVEEFQVDDPENVSLENAVIPVKFNYDDQVYDTSLNNIKITDPLGKEIECDFEALEGAVNIKPKQLEPDTEYNLVVDSVATKTPLFNPNKNPSWCAAEPRFVSMIEPATFTFKTVKKVDVLDKSYSSKTATVELKNNRSAEDSFYLAIYDENDGAVKSKLYYKKVNLKGNEIKEIEFENVNLSSDDFAVAMLDSFGGNLDEGLSSSSKLDIDFSTVNQTMGAYGYTDSEFCGKEISAIFVLPATDGSLQEIDSLNESDFGETDKICALVTTLVDSEAEFKFPQVPISKSGNYRVIAKLNGKVFADEEKFFSSKEDGEAFLKKINAVSGSDSQKAKALYEIFETEHNEQKIRYSEEFYNRLSSANKLLFCQNMVKQLPFANMDEFFAAFDNQSLLLVLIKETDPEIMAEIIDGNFEKEPTKRINKLLDLESLYQTTVYGAYSNLDYSDKVAFCQAFIDNNTNHYTDMKTTEDFLGGFAIVIINQNLESATLHKDVSEIINTYSDVLKDIKIKDYNKLGLYQSKVNDKIKSNVKYNLADFVDYVNDLIKNAKKENDAGGGTSGGKTSSKGSGGSGYSASTTIPPVSVVVPEKVYFNDMNNHSWAKQAVNGLYERKVISGKGNETFDPDGLITREEFVKLVIGAAGLKAEKPTEKIFDDVAQGEWYEGYITAAYNNNITKGMGDGVFGVGRNISRQDMFVMCSYLVENLTTSAAAEGSQKFGDKENIADYATDAVDKLTKLGIISGDDKGYVNPVAFATRAEAAKMIYNIMGLTGKL